MVPPVLTTVVDPEGAVGVPTVPMTVTLVPVSPDALQPAAATWTWAVPEYTAFQFTVAEAPEPVTLPALVGDNDQLYPVAFGKDVVA